MKSQDKLQFQYRNMENALFTGIAINKYKLTAKRMSDLPPASFLHKTKMKNRSKRRCLISIKRKLYGIRVGKKRQSVQDCLDT